MTNKGKDVKLKVNMHCEGCADTVRNCLRGFDGVEDIVTDTEKHEVIVKGENVDIVKVLERLRKKFNKNAELVSPELPKAKTKPEKEKKKEIPIKTVVLKIFMHCEGCVRDIKKSIYQMEGVLSVKPDMAGGTVAVKGAVELPKLVEHIKKQLGKSAEFVKEEATKDKKGEEKKKEEASKKDKKGEEKKKDKANEDGVHLIYWIHCPPLPQCSHCPHCCTNHLCCCCENVFSDENVHSCSIM